MTMSKCLILFCIRFSYYTETKLQLFTTYINSGALPLATATVSNTVGKGELRISRP